MESVSGFLSSDGKFFTSAEACRAYEQEIARLAAISKRHQEVLRFFSSGFYLSGSDGAQSGLPSSLTAFFAGLSEGDIEALWNDYLVFLFVDADREQRGLTVLHEIPATGGCRTSGPHDFCSLKMVAAYRLLAFVLGEDES